MTQDEIIELAKQAGLTSVDKKSQYLRDSLERFAKLVAQHERIACANIADSYVNGLEQNYSEIIAEKIIARGQE